MTPVAPSASPVRPERREPPVAVSADDAMFGTTAPRFFLVAIDMLSMAGAFFTAYLLAPHVRSLALSGGVFHDWIFALVPDPGGDFRPLHEMTWILFVMTAVVLLGFHASGAYRPLTTQTRTHVVVTGVLAPLVGLGAIALIPFSMRSQYWSRVLIFTFAATTIVWVTGYRLILRWYHLRRIASGFYARNVVLVGAPKAVVWMADHLRRTTRPDQYQLMGALHVASGPFHTLDGRDALPSLGDVKDFGEVLVHRPVHEVIAILGGDDGGWLQPLIDTCDYFRVTLRLVPEALLAGTLKDLHFVYRADPLRLPEVVLRPRDFASDALFVKRMIDITVSAFLLIALAPLFVILALAIKLTTPGLPVFYRWQVVGFKGRRFTGYKFTTMVADADARREAQALSDRNEMQGPVFKIKEDPRVTPLGRYLRKFSLNELPQLWSVLKGDMSLVGPRPAFPHELERYQLWHKRKLCVKPGITCLWQVSGRNRISRFDDWVRLDLEYIDKWNLWLDVKILMRTLWTVVSGTGS